MDHDPSEEMKLRGIQEALHRMEDLDPPDILLSSVMGAVREKRFPLWIRLLRWSKAPHSITVTPMRLAPVAIVLIGFCVAAVAHLLHDGRVELTLREASVPVVLALHAPQARSVSVIGSFNDWQPQSCQQKPHGGESLWTVTLRLPSGRYEYAFVVDGEKIVPDPGIGLLEDDGFGSQNAILLVGNGHGNSI